MSSYPSGEVTTGSLLIMALLHLAVGLLAAAAPTSALTFNVPASAPTNASAQLAEAPVGLS